LLSLFAALVLTVGACGGGSSNKKASSSSGAGSQTITIQNFKFNPDKLKVKVGDKVTVTNLDAGAPHSLRADDRSFNTGIFNKGDRPRTITLSKAGTFPYDCEVHTFMKGTITVS